MLERYCELLWDWNTKINLTRHTDYEKFVARDLVDSLAFAQFLEPKEKVLDVGTGGGVPGVVLAIVRDDLRISLCESVGKKARVVADIVERLGLQTPVLHARAEDVLAHQRFNTLVIRAVARLKKLLEWFRPHWKSFDRLLVLKGPSWVEERGEARHYGLLHDLALRKLTSAIRCRARSRRACCCKSCRSNRQTAQGRAAVGVDTIVGVAVALPPLGIAENAGVAVQLPPQQVEASPDADDVDVRTQSATGVASYNTNFGTLSDKPVDAFQHDKHHEHEADDPQGQPARVNQDRPHALVAGGGIDQADGQNGRQGIPEVEMPDGKAVGQK